MTPHQHAIARVAAFLVLPAATLAVVTTVAAVDSAALLYRLIRNR